MKTDFEQSKKRKKRNYHNIDYKVDYKIIKQKFRINCKVNVKGSEIIV